MNIRDAVTYLLDIAAGFTSNPEVFYAADYNWYDLQEAIDYIEETIRVSEGKREADAFLDRVEQARNRLDKY